MDDEAQGAGYRQLAEKISLLLESRGPADEELSEWLRDNGLHSEHLSVGGTGTTAAVFARRSARKGSRSGTVRNGAGLLRPRRPSW